MAKTETIQARINPEIKREAQKVLGQLHITMSKGNSFRYQNTKRINS